jgi:hypothetical protein
MRAEAVTVDQARIARDAYREIGKGSGHDCRRVPPGGADTSSLRRRHRSVVQP